ncbi:MAG TPA: monovalent cation:proton antiporter-2 (CPA2) family protein [Kofleriaceae bacterium]|nr:monovalent cation:proton antiporter-2 (CPA2) family protein [Kofleriaceae bacterium]
MTDSVLVQAFVYLCAAVVFVPISLRLGLGPVLGYLLAGVVIGPHVLGRVVAETHVMHFAEFGVVLLLFLVGLEVRPRLLWQMRRAIFLLGGLQVIVTGLAIAGFALALGAGGRAALALGLIGSMSSTTIVHLALGERGLLHSQGGEASFAVLLFQDIAAIPILALLPVLGDPGAGSGGAGGGGSGHAVWLSALLLLAALAGVIAASRFIVRPLFQALARARLRELFTAAALMLVVGIALAMQQVGVSPALGTFLAGVLLSESEYRHELQSDVEPFKGLLLGLFFITVGAQLDLGLIADRPLVVAGLVLATMTIKLGVLHGLGRLFGLDRPARWLLAMGLTQVGEFAFVLLSFGVTSRVFGDDTVRLVTPIVACSMLLTPFAFVALERWILPAVTERPAVRPPDEIHAEASQVVIAGFGRFGQVVGRLLRANGVTLTILDLDPDVVDMVGRVGIKVHYGDASREELLRAAGCEQAKLFVLAVDKHDVAVAIARTVQAHFPHLTILARARNRAHYFELRELGVPYVHREQFAAGFELGVDALRALGMRAYTAHRRAQAWRTHERKVLDELAGHWGRDQARYFARARAALDEAEQLLRAEDPAAARDRDAAWDAAPRRADTSTDSESTSGS